MVNQKKNHFLQDEVGEKKKIWMKLPPTRVSGWVRDRNDR